MRAGFAQTWEGFLPSGSIVMAKKSPAHSDQATAQSAAQTGFDLPFFFFTGAISAEENSLFQKIIQALGLTSDLYRAGEDLPPGLRPAVCVQFGGSAIGEWTEVEVMGTYVPLFSTHSLAELSRNASLKKETWSHLKVVCDRIGFAVPKR
jgi:hypothetical protein